MLRLELTDRATEPPGPPRTYLFDRGPVCVGRSLRQCHLSLRGNRISRVHVILDAAERRWWVVHRGRYAATLLNGREVAPDTPVELKHGDLLTIERNEIMVQIDADDAEVATDMIAASPELVEVSAKIAQHARRAATVAPPPVAHRPAPSAPKPSAAVSPTPSPQPPSPPPSPPPRAPAAPRPSAAVRAPEPRVVRTTTDELFATGGVPDPPVATQRAPSPPPPRPVESPAIEPPPIAPPPAVDDRPAMVAVRPPVSPPPVPELRTVVAVPPVPHVGTAPPPRLAPRAQDETREAEGGVPPPPEDVPASELMTAVGQVVDVAAMSPAPPPRAETPASPPAPPLRARTPAPDEPAAPSHPRREGDTAFPLPPGTDRFDLQRQLRIGGIGPIWVATDVSARREVVVERLPAGLLSGDADERAFRALSNTLQGVAHRAVVRVVECGVDRYGPFQILDLPPGRTLADFIAAHPGGASSARILEIADELADGVARLNECGVIHGNVHTGTVWIGQDGHARLLDAGLAEFVQRRAAFLPEADLGGVGYYAPELARRATGDPRSDQFGVAAVLYAYLAGQDPSSTAPSLRTVRKDVARNIIDAIERALSPRPDARFATIQEFRAALYTGPHAATATAWKPVAAVAISAVVLAGFLTGLFPRLYRTMTRDDAGYASMQIQRERATAAEGMWNDICAAGMDGSEAAAAAEAAMDDAAAADRDARDAAAELSYKAAADQLETLVAAHGRQKVKGEQARAEAKTIADLAVADELSKLLASASADAGRGDFGDAERKYDQVIARVSRHRTSKLNGGVSLDTTLNQARDDAAFVVNGAKAARAAADRLGALVAAPPQDADAGTVTELRRAKVTAEAEAARLEALASSAEAQAVSVLINDAERALAENRTGDAEALVASAAATARVLADAAKPPK